MHNPYKQRIIVFAIFITILFIGCKKVDSKVVTYYDAESTLPSSDSNMMYISRWRLVQGQLKGEQVDNLVCIAEETPKYVRVFNSEYLHLGVPEYKLEYPLFSGWRIDLDCMYAVGLTESGRVVFSSNNKSPLVICVFDCDSGQINCMLRADMAEKGMGGNALDSFILLENLEELEHQQTLDDLWNAHISAQEYPHAVPILDGEWQYYCLHMVHKDDPALQYELNYGVCEDEVYIENLEIEDIIQLPVAESIE